MVGIDAGAAVLALDNYLMADRVRTVFQGLPCIRRGMKRLGIAPKDGPPAVTYEPTHALIMRRASVRDCGVRVAGSSSHRNEELLAGAPPISSPKPLSGNSEECFGLRVLLLQMLLKALIFADQNAGWFADLALLSADAVAAAALGLSWTAFCLLHAFTGNVVKVCPLVVGRCAGRGDDRAPGRAGPAPG
jgi:hypothetical protein